MYFVYVRNLSIFAVIKTVQHWLCVHVSFVTYCIMYLKSTQGNAHTKMFFDLNIALKQLVL